MIVELITEQLDISTTDAIAVAALFLVAIISIRAFKLMQIGSEFDKQYKTAAANAHKSGDKSFFNIDDKAWKKEFIANRLGGAKRYHQQRKQKAAFYSSRPGQTSNYSKSKPQSKPIQKNEFKSKTVKTKYGISNKKSLHGQRLDKDGKRHFAQPARPYQQRELKAGRDPQTIKQFRDEMKGKKFNPEKFNTNTGKTLSNIRSSRQRHGKVFI